MMGIFLRASFVLISFTSAGPVISGICISVKIRSKNSFAETEVCKRDSAALALSASTATQPQDLRYSPKINRFVGLSSTTSTFKRPKSGSFSSRTAVWGSCLVRTAVNQKVLPLPSSLSSPISPPMSSVNSFAMLVPSPVPPYFLLVESSACVKLSNIFGCFSRGMPMPVSLTEKRTLTFSPRSSAISPFT